MALLGELPTLSGASVLRGQVGYSAQQPWIQSGSVRDNILFGNRYEHARYRRTLKLCALTKVRICTRRGKTDKRRDDLFLLYKTWKHDVRLA